jgi:hypothetical protein
VRGVILFGSHARGNARPDSDADLVILGERDQFEMGFAERDGQKFELLEWSEAVAIRYATDNPDNAADFWQVPSQDLPRCRFGRGAAVRSTAWPLVLCARSGNVVEGGRRGFIGRHQPTIRGREPRPARFRRRPAGWRTRA